MGGWNLPDDVSDSDPRAPWNQDECEELGGCEDGEHDIDCHLNPDFEDEPDWDSMPGGADDDDR